MVAKMFTLRRTQGKTKLHKILVLIIKYKTEAQYKILHFLSPDLFLSCSAGLGVLPL